MMTVATNVTSHQPLYSQITGFHQPPSLTLSSDQGGHHISILACFSDVCYHNWSNAQNEPWSLSLDLTVG